MEIGVSNEIQRTVLDSLVPYTYVGPRYAVLRVILLVVDGIKGSTSYTAPWERKYSIAVLRTTAGDPSSAVHDARVTILLPFVTDTVTAEPHVLDPLVFMGFLLQMFEFFTASNGNEPSFPIILLSTDENVTRHRRTYRR